MVLTKIKDFFSISLGNIRKRKVRSWLTILGIVIGVAAIIALISVGQGMSNAIESQLNAFGPRMIRVVPGSLQTGPPTGTSVLTVDDAKALESINELEYSAFGILQDAEVEYKNEKELLMVGGFPYEHLEDILDDSGLKIIEGNIQSSAGGKEVLISEKVAEEIFDNQIKLKNNIVIKGEKFKVVGIYEKSGTDFDKRIVMTHENAKELLNTGNKVSFLTANVKEGENIDSVADEIKRKLERSRGDDKFEVYTPQQLLDTVKGILGVVNIVLIGIAFISLLVGTIGIMNSMFTSVLERTREIGIMKAIGAKNSDIMSLFIIESGFVGLVGGVIGIALGIGMALAVEVIANIAGFPFMDVRIDLNLILMSTAFSFIIGVVAGTLPAMRASRLKPVIALRYE